jgi:hypothetical protein
MSPLLILVKFVVFVAGVSIVARALMSAVRVFVLPRGSNEPIARFVFSQMGRLFRLVAKPSRPYAFRDRVMAYFAPVSLLVLPIVWLSLVLIGYTGIFWALGVEGAVDALRVSGSSLFTLGFAPTTGLPWLAGELRPAAPRPCEPDDGPAGSLERSALGGHRDGQSEP